MFLFCFRMKPVAMCQRVVLLSVLVSALVLVRSDASASDSAPRKSSQDQYEQRDDQAQTETNGHKSLHRVSLTSTGFHDLSLIPTGQQTGRVYPAGTRPLNPENEESSGDNTREKRDYVRWYSAVNSQYNPPIHSVHIQGFQTSGQSPEISSRWRNQAQPQITPPLFRHPYQVFIPLWGNPSRIPIFFPQKPIIFNPGYPSGNRPSQPFPPTKPEGTTDTPPTDGFGIPELPNRFGDPNNPEYGPVWGVVDDDDTTGGGSGSATQRPTTTTTRRPATTRRPMRPITPVIEEDPPLFHRPSHGERGEHNVPSVNNPASGSNASPPTLETSVPPSEEELQEVFTRRPVSSTPRATRELNRCVWSIISCCSPTDSNIRYNCFENLGCPGAFWDGNPCSKDVIQAALNAANAFYDNN